MQNGGVKAIIFFPQIITIWYVEKTAFFLRAINISRGKRKYESFQQ